MTVGNISGLCLRALFIHSSTLQLRSRIPCAADISDVTYLHLLHRKETAIRIKSSDVVVYPEREIRFFIFQTIWIMGVDMYDGAGVNGRIKKQILSFTSAPS